MPTTLDLIWEYSEPIDPHNCQRVRYKLCGKEISGGFSDLKIYHHAKILGHEVDVFPSYSSEIMHFANQEINAMNKKKYEKKELRLELAARSC